MTSSTGNTRPLSSGGPIVSPPRPLSWSSPPAPSPPHFATAGAAIHERPHPSHFPPPMAPRTVAYSGSMGPRSQAPKPQEQEAPVLLQWFPKAAAKASPAPSANWSQSQPARTRSLSPLQPQSYSNRALDESLSPVTPEPESPERAIRALRETTPSFADETGAEQSDNSPDRRAAQAQRSVGSSADLAAMVVTETQATFVVADGSVQSFQPPPSWPGGVEQCSLRSSSPGRTPLQGQPRVASLPVSPAQNFGHQRRPSNASGSERY